MDATTMPAPVITGLDAVTQAVAALCYFAIGLGAWLRAPADIRTRVFFAYAVANVTAFTIPAIAWGLGVTDPSQLPRAATAAVGAALGVGALLLFHFTQVFPRRRPWIEGSGSQMAVAYLLTPVVIASLVRFWPGSMAAVTPAYIAGFLVFGFPLLVLLGFVLPLSAIVSLLRSYRESVAGGLQVARPVGWILVSQIAGGVLAIVFAPALTAAAPGTAVVPAMTLLIWLLGLLTPAAFAAAVWRFGLLSTEA